LEVAMMEEACHRSAEDVPAIILKDAQHKLITNELNEVKKSMVRCAS
jgi:hypothetical protein